MRRVHAPSTPDQAAAPQMANPSTTGAVNTSRVMPERVRRRQHQQQHAAATGAAVTMTVSRRQRIASAVHHQHQHHAIDDMNNNLDVSRLDRSYLDGLVDENAAATATVAEISPISANGAAGGSDSSSGASSRHLSPINLTTTFMNDRTSEERQAEKQFQKIMDQLYKLDEEGIIDEEIALMPVATGRKILY